MKAEINSKSRSGLETIMLPSVSLWLIVLPVAAPQDFIRWLIAAFRVQLSSESVLSSTCYSPALYNTADFYWKIELDSLYLIHST